MAITDYNQVKKIVGKEMKAYKAKHPNGSMADAMKAAYKSEAVKKARAEYEKYKASHGDKPAKKKAPKKKAAKKSKKASKK
jgi:hypothetical protein